MREIQHQASVVHQIDVGIRQKGDQHVDVAVGAHVSAGGGPEKRKLPDAVSSAEICQVGLIDLRVTELREIQHQASVVHQIDVGIRQKGDQHVDVAGLMLDLS